MTTGPDTLVVHPGGALGDFVLCWPVVRTLISAGRRVGMVSAASRAKLTAQCLDVIALPDHLTPWPRLWAGDAPAGSRDTGVSLVIAFGERPTSWIDAAKDLFPRARVLVETGTLDRVLALELASRFAGESGPDIHGLPRNVPNRRVVLHAGSGGVPKQWPLTSWVGLADLVVLDGHGVELIAGESERERWSGAEQSLFDHAGGRFIEAVDEMADLLSPAMAFVGADCGPSHLSAQLGTPTLALFGPTSPERWAPVGRLVRILEAKDGTMRSIGVDEVKGGLDHLIAESRQS